ncbi:MAG TPA: hypothetical protein VN764_14100, partial [Polyangiaceae bacterium]|nr:hypothetical protein [Polyangiaceae bacterium]
MSRVRLRLPGEKRSEVHAPSELNEYLAVVGGAVTAKTIVAEVRRGGAMEHSVIDAEDQDVLQLRWGDDVVELVRVSDLSERFSGQLRRSGEELELPAWHSLKSTVRGEEGLPLRSIEHIALKATEAATGLILPSAIRQLEEKHMPHPGVFDVRVSGKLGDEIKPGNLSGGGPILALLHGTFSSTATGFADLLGSNEWSAVHEHYTRQGGRVIALEQHTVRESPVKHALDLARVLPQGAQLHLLSHSRGGLIGELLARHPWNSEPESLEYFFRKVGADDRYAPIREELAALSEVLTPLQLQIGRFVRVAAPAAGTLLASERLDQYLNVVLSVLSKVVSSNAPWFSFVKAIATTIVQARTKVNVCPGLEAMMPHLDRGLVPFLNAVKETDAKSSNLAVVAGDVEGGNAFDRIKAFFADLYFNEANDFVVDSASMLRGVRRTAPVGIYHRAPQANHFSYFSDQRLREDMTKYLRGAEGHRFVPLDSLGTTAETRGGAFGFGKLEQDDLAAQPGKPVVFLLPGIMGSHLGQQDNDKKLDRIWVDLWNLTFGGLDRIRLGRPGVVPDGVVRGYYKGLAEYLNTKNEVRLLPFDWRLPIVDSARLLKVAIEKALAENRTIRILAHSMGGLVSRTFIWEHPEIWNKVVARGGRLVMLGTPNFGSYVPAQVFTQQHGLMRKLAVLDSKNNLK